MTMYRVVFQTEFQLTALNWPWNAELYLLYTYMLDFSSHKTTCLTQSLYRRNANTHDHTLCIVSSQHWILVIPPTFLTIPLDCLITNITVQL